MATLKKFCVLSALLALVGGCSTSGDEAATGTTSTSVTSETAATATAATATSNNAVTAAAKSASVRLGWGSGDGQVGGLARGTERMAEGPSAVAVGPDGSVYLLDRLNGRVLRMTGRGATVVATVPQDSEELAVGADPTGQLVIGAWSPLRARVWLRAGGQDVGEVTVPRALRLARGIALTTSRQVLVHNAHQETYRLGSPATGRSLAAVLHSKREGAVFLADGSGVQVRRRPSDGRAEVLVLTAGERAHVARRILLDDVVLGVRLVGATAGHLCMRLEKAAVGANAKDGAAAGEPITVRREAVCVRADDGAEVLRAALPAVGRYLPRRELALGGSPARLVLIHPTETGLEVLGWTLPTASARAEVTR